MAISDYITVIAQQRDILKENLKTQNIDVEGCDTFNQLTPKVLDIVTNSKTGAQNGVWTPTITADTFYLSGLDFLPSKLSICCEDVLTKNYTAVTDYINIAILNIELTSKETDIIKNGMGTGVAVDTSGISADVTVENINGLYSIKISFEQINSTLDTPYSFKANASHIWCVAEEGWLI